jgi:hypothetical protein
MSRILRNNRLKKRLFVQGTPSQCAEGSPSCLTGDQLIAALGFDQFTVRIPFIFGAFGQGLLSFFNLANAPFMGSL